MTKKADEATLFPLSDADAAVRVELALQGDMTAAADKLVKAKERVIGCESGLQAATEAYEAFMQLRGAGS